ncbi:hypothetical protein EDD15DRAFT_1154159 [Pisolithus albus]|nr:hypothetical protein EDD15DRAFT_1154159 [Pisolithus albus]
MQKPAPDLSRASCLCKTPPPLGVSNRHDAPLTNIAFSATEVLGKLPVLQHFLFGSILPLRWTSSTFRDSNGCTHGGHVHEGWGDCCGIPIPSAFAAQEKEEGRSRGPGYYLFHLIDMIKHNGVGSW